MKHHGHKTLRTNCRHSQRRTPKTHTTTVLELWCATQYLYTALGRRSAHSAHSTTTNSRIRMRRCAQFTYNDCLGIVECHPVFVCRPGLAVRPQCPRHYHNRRRSSDSVQHLPCRSTIPRFFPSTLWGPTLRGPFLLVPVGACWCVLVPVCVWWVKSRFLGLSAGPPPLWWGRRGSTRQPKSPNAHI